MITDMKIRLLKAEDASQLKDIRISAIKNARNHIDANDNECQKSIKSYEKDIKEKYFYGAFDNKKLIAIASLSIEDDTNHKHKAFLGSMYSLPEYRGNNLGQKFMNLRIAKAKTVEEIDFIRSDVILPNDRVEALLQKNGFEKMYIYKDVWKRDDKYFDCAMYQLWIK